jgi:glutathione peroxidase-family protein
MALSKSIQTEYQVPATYWNIGWVQEDFKNKSVEVLVYGYASKEARDANAQHMHSIRFGLQGDQYVAGQDRAALYATLKQQADFTDATDV